MKMRIAMDGTFIANALVGVNPIQRTAIEITGALKKSTCATGFFDSQEEAMDWAVEEHKKHRKSSSHK